MRTLALAISKGGQGKTSLAVHLATGLAREGARVLLVDLDPGAHATRWLLPLALMPAAGAAEAMAERKFRPNYLVPVPDRPGLQLAGATRALASRDLDDRLRASRRAQSLAKALEGAATSFDFAVIDCPPTLDAVVLEGLSAADGLVIPMEPGFMPLGGIRDLEETLERTHVRASVLGYVLFRTDDRERVTRETRESMERNRPGLLFASHVRVSAAAKTLAARRATAWDDGTDPRGAEDYAQILDETKTKMAAPTRAGKAAAQ